MTDEERSNLTAGQRALSWVLSYPESRGRRRADDELKAIHRSHIHQARKIIAYNRQMAIDVLNGDSDETFTSALRRACKEITIDKDLTEAQLAAKAVNLAEEKKVSLFQAVLAIGAGKRQAQRAQNLKARDPQKFQDVVDGKATIPRNADVRIRPGSPRKRLILFTEVVNALALKAELMLEDPPPAGGRSAEEAWVVTLKRTRHDILILINRITR